MFVRFGNNILNTSNLSHIHIGYEFGGFMTIFFIDNRGNKNKFTLYPSDFEGYEYNVYFNEELMYQADYSYIGEIKTSIGTSRYDAIEFFIENNGKFNYFGTW